MRRVVAHLPALRSRGLVVMLALCPMMTAD